MKLHLTCDEFERTGKVTDLIFMGPTTIPYGAASLIAWYLFVHYRSWKHADPGASFRVHDGDNWYLASVLEMTSFSEGDDVYFESMTVEIDSTYSPESIAVLDLGTSLVRLKGDVVP